MTTTTSAAGSTTSTSFDFSSLNPTQDSVATDPAADRFLTLLVTQLKNQDPLNPLDNAQITTQLAQLSTVSGIKDLNTTLTALSTSMDAKQYLQAANLVGHLVAVDGNGMTLVNHSAAGAFDLSGDADHVTVSIKNGAGAVVRQIDLGSESKGIVSFEWDGMNATGGAEQDGAYTLSVSATRDGNAISATPLAVARVTGLVPGVNGGSLNVQGVGRVDVSAIRQIS